MTRDGDITHRTSAARLAVVVMLLSSLLAACKPGFSERTSQDLAANMETPYDYAINGMHTYRFTPAGKALFQLTASKVTHFASDDHAELTNPVLHWYNTDGAPWHLSAEHGTHAGATEELTLVDDVKANTTLAQSGPLLLETTVLNILPNQKLARTNAAVQVTASSLNVQGTGLLLNLTGNTIDLQNEVRGSYAP